jgi:hypothetical protein
MSARAVPTNVDESNVVAATTRPIGLSGPNLGRDVIAILPAIGDIATFSGINICGTM